MEQTFEGILSSLLDSYENNESKDFDTLLNEKREELGLTEDNLTLIKDAAEYIDKFSEKAISLEAARDEGISTYRWMMEDLDNSMKELSDEEKTEIMEGLSKNLSECLDDEIKECSDNSKEEEK